MHHRRTLFAVLIAAVFSLTSAFAGDPTGSWKWTSQGRDGQTRENVAKLALVDGKLSGTVTGRNGQEIPISDATFANDQLAFVVNVDMGERKFTIKYSGKLDADTITGTIERPSREGDVRKDEWKATRAK